MDENMKDPQSGNENEGPKGDVQFGGGHGIAVTGILGGVVIALGLPWILLAYGQVLGTTLVTILVCGALVIGGGVSIVSAFFGLVMPKVVRGHWRGRWPGHHGGVCGHGAWKEEDYSDYAQWAEPDWQNWSLQDWKVWGEKMKKKWEGKSGR